MLLFTAALLVVAGYCVVQIFDGNPRALSSRRGFRPEVYIAICYGLFVSIGLSFRGFLFRWTRQDTIVWWSLVILLPIIGVLYEAGIFGTRRGVSLANLAVFALFATMVLSSWKVFWLLETSDRRPKPNDMTPDQIARVRELSELILRNPDGADAYLNRGRAYRAAKQFDLAKADFEEARRLTRASRNAPRPE